MEMKNQSGMNLEFRNIKYLYKEKERKIYSFLQIKHI